MREITSGIMILAIAILGYGYRFCPTYQEYQDSIFLNPNQKTRIVCLLDVLSQPDDPPRSTTSTSSSLSSSLSAMTASETTTTTTLPYLSPSQEP